MVDAFLRPLFEAAFTSLSENTREWHQYLTNSEVESELKRQEIDVEQLRRFDQLLSFATAAERSGELVLGRQMKDLIFDIEEIRQSWSTLSSPFILLDTVGRTLAREISSIRNHRIQPISRIIHGLKDLRLLQNHPTKPNNKVVSVKRNTEAPPIGIHNNIVGLDYEAANLISSLKEKSKELDVISITGMPGSGKTTLAWKIYQHEEIRERFENRIWVDISERFSLEDVCIRILKEFCYDIKSDNIDEIIKAVRNCLGESRFFLVLNDVWSSDTLSSIMALLPRNGKVLLVSCKTSVCVAANNRRKPHTMSFLNGEKSWDLLQLVVFGKLGECPEMLKYTGQCIANKCGGLPLAIIAVANSLMAITSTVASEYPNDKWWKKVSENVMAFATDHDDQQRVFSGLQLSYIQLAPHVQDCFLYMGVFPEGHEIPVRTLTLLWIAEGFVQDGGRMTLEETAEQILDDLIDRNLVMVGKRYPNGQVKKCCIHKLIHRFCRYKAAEQGFYYEYFRISGVTVDRPMPLAPNYRRLCIYSTLSEFLSSGPNGACVRSVLCLNKEEEVLPRKHCSTFHESFELLRVLECKLVKFNKFPKKLRKMMNLRYIALSCKDLAVIPANISSLCFLKTLVVDTQLASIELRANIWKMPELRHLVTKAAIVLALPGEGEAGKNLQTLTRLTPECCSEDVFRRAPNLKKLGIRGQLAALLSAQSFSKLECLQHLKLINETQLHCTLHPHCLPSNLKSLALSATYLEWESMSVLAKIDSLEILKLKDNAFRGASWNTDAGGFRRLGFLYIGTTDLVSWVASSAGCFPQLRWLVLEDCRQLKEIPSILSESLDKLDVENVSKSAFESARQIQQGINRREK